MNRSFKIYLSQTQVPYFLLTFLLGFSSYFLKLVSIVKLIDEISLSSYPALMLIQAFTVFSFLSFCTKMSKISNEKLSQFIFLSSAVLIMLSNNEWLMSSSKELGIPLVPIIIYLISANLGLALEISVQTMVSSKASVLKNPQLATQMTFMMEIGAIAGAMVTYFFVAGSSYWQKNILMTLPFFLMAGIVLGLNKLNTNYKVYQVSKGEEELVEPVQVNKYHYPFMYWFIGLVAVISILKFTQGFGMIYGLFELKNSGHEELMKLFSKVSLVQTLIIMTLYLPKLFFRSAKMTWGKGFRFFLWGQTVLMTILAITINPIALIGTDVVRKIIQHVFLDESMGILFSSIPAQARLELRNTAEKYSNMVGFGFLALFSFLGLNGFLPWPVLWGSVGAIAGLGIFLRQKLYDHLSDFQVSNIVRSNIDEAIFSCYCLANKEAIKHHYALVSLLKNNPKPELAKAIVFALGEMQDSRTLEFILDYYKKTENEDMQLCVIQALVKFKSHRVDLFLLRSLISMIKEQTSLGEIRRSIFFAITTRLRNMAVPAILSILEENDQDHRIVANAIVVLCEISELKADEEIYDVLSCYLEPKYSRRVRSDAVVGLYHTKKYHLPAVSVLNSFLTSSEQYDRSAVSYIAGKLHLTGLTPFILENSAQANHKSSTLLIALLNLRYPKAHGQLADLIINDTKDMALTAINQLSVINNKKLRYNLYFEIFARYPEKINYLLSLLSESKRDFEMDRQMIIKEARRMGLAIHEEVVLFEKKEATLAARAA